MQRSLIRMDQVKTKTIIPEMDLVRLAANALITKVKDCETATLAELNSLGQAQRAGRPDRASLPTFGSANAHNGAITAG